MGRER